MLATVEDVKAKLELAATDTSRDDALLLVLGSASEKVLELTRRLEFDVQGRVDTLRDVQVGVPFLLSKRPVANVVAEYRPVGSAAWAGLTEDVLDAERGEVIVVGADSWPPSTVRPLSWRTLRYDLVRVTYNVEGTDSGEAVEPARLRDAAAALAAYWFDRQVGGAAKSLSVGFLKKEYLDLDVPAWVTALLGDDATGAGALLVT